MICGRCADSVQIFDPVTGFGTKFELVDGKYICEHCRKKTESALAKLAELKQRKAEQKELQQTQEQQEGIVKRKRGRPSKDKTEKHTEITLKKIKAKVDGRGSFWKKFTPAEREAHIQKMQAARKNRLDNPKEIG